MEIHSVVWGIGKRRRRRRRRYLRIRNAARPCDRTLIIASTENKSFGSLPSDCETSFSRVSDWFIRLIKNSLAGCLGNVERIYDLFSPQILLSIVLVCPMTGKYQNTDPMDLLTRLTQSRGLWRHREVLFQAINKILGKRSAIFIQWPLNRQFNQSQPALFNHSNLCEGFL